MRLPKSQMVTFAKEAETGSALHNAFNRRTILHFGFREDGGSSVVMCLRDLGFYFIPDRNHSPGFYSHKPPSHRSFWASCTPDTCLGARNPKECPHLHFPSPRRQSSKGFWISIPSSSTSVYISVPIFISRLPAGNHQKASRSLFLAAPLSLLISLSSFISCFPTGNRQKGSRSPSLPALPRFTSLSSCSFPASPPAIVKGVGGGQFLLNRSCDWRTENE